MTISTVGSGFVIGACGATAMWQTTFYDLFGNVTQPSNANIRIAYYQSGQAQVATVAMSSINALDPSSPWRATWDTDGVDPGWVHYAIYTTGLPRAVANGKFVLDANNATTTF